MATLELPKSSKSVVVLGLAFLVVATYTTISHLGYGAWLLVVGLLASGYISDFFTGVAHFCFDYVFPYRTPIFGPISKEFTDHHEQPTLDPSNFVDNLTKGSYASIPVAIVVVACAPYLSATLAGSLVLATLWGAAVWAFHFHQIHSYAHMGSHIAPEEFTRRASEIARLPSKADQVRAFREMFDRAPIPWPVRQLQRWRLILTPERHNIHHLNFDADFSSVNGWSDPLLNLVATPLARRYKSIPDRQR